MLLAKNEDAATAPKRGAARGSIIQRTLPMYRVSRTRVLTNVETL